MNQLEDKIALITGGARGQGAAEARLFVAQGSRVVIADVLDTEGQKLADELGEAALYQHLDVTCAANWEHTVQATLRRFGKLDILVNNAGIIKLGPIETFSLEDYRRVVDVNQIGCWLGMKSVLPAMKTTGGAIVNTSSIAGLEGVAYGSAYVASKFAIRGMTKVAALEFGRYNIRVNSVHPGGVDTHMGRPPEFADMDPSATYRGLPIPRIGRPEEIADLVLFLASDQSSYCTGAEFVIDGGMLAGTSFSA
ncbi:glucose 1-dehydrogenase [Burkholderia stabilis]|uniref:3-alpha-(Or 20-beta)-hydroxysteroid dehydrogenase n=1 Tax=Burkholderia stabilis TaxID=95485 RepID=A0AAJ5NA45_9BURK|nr:glucose 1-dehydrogenase [Burkholderia stabilis]VBB14638.1 3-alpha-(or 20-beta)-hydroxysteroid dehydrogenase [Burkholderia stabilis]